MSCHTNAQNYIQKHETKSIFVFLYEFRVNVRPPTNVRTLKSKHINTLVKSTKTCETFDINPSDALSSPHTPHVLG